MKAYTFKFNGVNPVGACGVVVSTSKVFATKVANQELMRKGFEPIRKEDLVQIDLTTEQANILLDGNY